MTQIHTGFRHFRHWHEGGVPTTKGGVTMAFCAGKHIQDLTADDVVQIEFAFCSGLDNFQRAAGRMVSLQRLQQTPISIPGDVFVALIHARHALELPWLLATSQLLCDATVRAFKTRVVKSIGTC